MSDMVRVFIGHDHVEEVAYHTMTASIIRRASIPVSITPIELSHLKDIFNRPRNDKQSNEFSFSRFLVPYLCNYEGWAIFMDCDMIFRSDIKDLWSFRDESYAVRVAKHDYTPKDQVKYLGNAQHAYPRKNWSSVMLMNCAKCRVLTPEMVEKASGMYLHRFEWLKDSQIGHLPLEFNWLVGEYEATVYAKVAHFTVGGPYFKEYDDCDYADEWRDNYRYMTYVKQHE